MVVIIDGDLIFLQHYMYISQVIDAAVHDVVLLQAQITFIHLSQKFCTRLFLYSFDEVFSEAVHGILYVLGDTMCGFSGHPYRPF